MRATLGDPAPSRYPAPSGWMRTRPALLVTCICAAWSPLACTPAGGGSETNDPRADLPFLPAGPDAAPDPALLGPYAVGVQTRTFVDTARVTEGFAHPRKLVTEIWYPAAEVARGATEEYRLHDYLSEAQQQEIPPAALGSLVTAALRDAPVRASGETWPVVLFSHGKGGIRMQSTFFTVALASHGYIVIAPDHEGDTLQNLLDEGDVLISSTTTAFLDRPTDMSFLISTLETLPSEPLRDAMDLDRIGIAGHSFGALTSLRTAGFDPRIDAVLAHTPVGIGLVELGLEVPVDRLGIPVMLQAGGMDRTLPADLHAESVWEHLVAPRYFLMLEQAGHFTFSDLCILDVATIDATLDNIDASNVLTDGCGTDNVSPERALPAIRHYSIAFFNRWLRDSPGSERHLGPIADQAPEGIQLDAGEAWFRSDSGP